MDRAEHGLAFHSYLAAKKPLDDRSLNEFVWRSFVEALGAGTSEHPLRVIEIGAGIGTMLERLVERTTLSRVEYFAIDSDPGHAPRAAARLEAWAAGHAGTSTALGPHEWRLETPGTRLDVHWKVASLFDDRLSLPPAHAVLAHAFLDLVDLARALPRVLGPLERRGLFYFSLNFDGLTAFLPEIDPALDQAILRAYHASMDERRDGAHASGDSRTGRRLLVELPRHGGEIIAAGASDWVIWPRREGYAEGEAGVLGAVLEMVERTVSDDPSLSAEALASWLARRRRQLQDHELVFIAHQLDVLGRMS